MDELEITPADVKARLERGENLILVDVREPWEYELCRIEGAKLVPLGALATSLQTLPDVDEVICYCHHGMRSLDAAAWLRFQGIEKAKSMIGGIERWSLDIDPNVPRY
ncbi:MAG TPA: rhodanese-like domain-containing protein [Candidatus Acidoferrum sp.]|jgi:adenylyltransferase/sulfurtransferase|nr:rhodanese-like domain-containing protein [Candidatus Acidoferrum sp.]